MSMLSCKNQWSPDVLAGTGCSISCCKDKVENVFNIKDIVKGNNNVLPINFTNTSGKYIALDNVSNYPSTGNTLPFIMAGTFTKSISIPTDYVNDCFQNSNCNGFAKCSSLSPPADILDTSNSSYISCDNPRLIPVTTTWKLTASPPSCCSLLKSS